MTQCCCGKYQMDLGDGEFIHNDVVHQVLGPPGNFCGAKYTHMVVRFEKEIEKLKNKIEELESDPDGRDMIYKKNVELISINQRLTEERDKAVEYLSMKLENLNKNGKTILDFQAVWIRQARSTNEKLQARVLELQKKLFECEKFKQGYYEQATEGWTKFRELEREMKNKGELL